MVLLVAIWQSKNVIIKIIYCFGCLKKENDAIILVFKVTFTSLHCDTMYQYLSERKWSLRMITWESSLWHFIWRLVIVGRCLNNYPDGPQEIACSTILSSYCNSLGFSSSAFSFPVGLFTHFARRKGVNKCVLELKGHI